MNGRIKKLFVCCLDNKVFAIDTNYKGFYNEFKLLVPDCRKEWYYQNKLIKEGCFNEVIGGKTYHFQKIL